MSRTPRNWPYIVTVWIVWALMLGALGISASHIIESAQKLGLAGWESYTTPALVDAIAIVGKLGRLDRFTEETRRSSLKLLVFGGCLSLAANIYAGENIGERAYGALLVVAFLLLENHATKLRAKVAPVVLTAVDVSAIAPVSPGMPPAALEPREVLAFRAAQVELRRTGSIPGLDRPRAAASYAECAA